MGKKKVSEKFMPPEVGKGKQFILIPGKQAGSPWLTNSNAYKKYLNEHFEKLQELKDIASGMNMYQPMVRNYRK